MARDIVIVSGYAVRCPLGGYLWQSLQYLVGLRDLGFDPYFYEDNAHYSACFDPHTRDMGDDASAGIDAVGRLFAEHGFGERWVYADVWRGETFGLAAAARDAVLSRARAWLSISAVNRMPEPWRGRAATAFIDIDPGYTQINAVHDRAAAELLSEHAHHFTVGERIGTSQCSVPTAGFSWRPTRQPIALDAWVPLPPEAEAPYTTIGRWDERSRDVELDGVHYAWRKRVEWMKFLSLPTRTGEPFRLAMDVGSVPGDADLLARHGWQIVDPIEVSADASRYRDFIRRSKGEFTVAKDLNVRLRTGWFSDRAACYLAAGRPVLNQDTGFDAALPVGRGLFAFRTEDEAAAAIAAIRGDYATHSAAARAIAGEHFAAERVLAPIVAVLM